MACKLYRLCGIPASVTCHDDYEANIYCGKRREYYRRENMAGFSSAQVPNIEEGALQNGTLTKDGWRRDSGKR